MSNPEEFEFDPYEYARELANTDELTRSDLFDPPKGEEEKGGLTRRDVLARGAAGAAAVAGLGALAAPAAAKTAAPATPSGGFTGTLRMISLGVEWPPGAQEQAEKDLGFKFNVQVMGTNQQVQKSVTDPESFDVGGLYNYQFFPIWPTGNFMPVDRTKINAWNSFYPIFTRGKVLPNRTDCTYGQGNAPFRVLFLDTNGSTGLPRTKEGPRTNRQIVQWVDEFSGKPIKPQQPRNIVGPPAHFNMDSMGYNGDVIKKRPEQVSWAELLNPAHRGRVALLNDPGIITQDTGNAAQAAGLLKFNDIGNMTRAELDSLVKVLIRFKKQKHFRAFWNQFADSVNLMASKEVVIESMWSPAVALLVAQGVNCRYAFPKEGMRGWCSAQGIPKHVGSDPAKLAAVYRYLNWMYEGFLGALIMRQGYYIANGSKLPAWLRSARAQEGRPAFSPAEYDFWYNGKPAPSDLPGITGQVGDIKKGQIRDGGSFFKRSCKYSSWNSFFADNVYQVKRINEFLSA
jgi:putative spermidine/putrescine transport system substrate-binding protein